MRRVLPCALLVLLCTSIVEAKEWRGILPLHSTRADVEALLGQPAQPVHPGGYNYSLDEAEVYIVFSDACPSVKPGTVLMIHVTPKNEIPVSSLNLNEQTFTKFNPSENSDLGYEGFIDKKDGLIIRALKGAVDQFVYFAAASDQTRCSAYYEDPESFVRIIVCGLGARKFDEYSDIRWAEEKARLDNFAIQLMNDENAIGQIIVYAGRKATVAEAQVRANRARDYLISVRKLNPERLKAVDGGYRDDLTIQLYLTPPDTEPPVMPTLDPSQVEIIYEKKRQPRKKNR